MHSTRTFSAYKQNFAAQQPPYHSVWITLTTFYLFHLSLRHSSAVINDPSGLEAGGLVELDEKLADHVGQILDDLLAEQLLLKARKETQQISVNF